MKKQLLIILIIGFCFVKIQAQSYADSTNTHLKRMYVGLGLNYSSFQDIKFSDVQYSGFGTAFEFGYNITADNYFWEASLNINYSSENASTHNSGVSLVVNPTIYFKYLKSIKNNIFIGGRIDLSDFYYRKIEGLGNNSIYYINSHHLYASLIYKNSLNKNWNLQSSIDLGILSFMKESTSFAFSAPQNGLEDGEFSYQNETLENPFGYKYFQIKHLANNINIQTSFIFNYKKRLSIGYLWRIRHFSNVKSYPVTTGLHSVVLRYSILNKIKNK